MPMGNTDMPTITVNECQAMRYLAADGYDIPTLKMMFQCGRGTVTRHVNDNCGHPTVTGPVHADPPLGHDLKHERLLRGMDTDDLADIIDVAPSAITQWELGEAEPNASNAKKLEQALADADVDPEARAELTAAEVRGSL